MERGIQQHDGKTEVLHEVEGGVPVAVLNS
jgi:hypothetical protein